MRGTFTAPLLAGMMLLPAPCFAQSTPSATQSGIFISGNSAPPPAKTCVQVQVAGQAASSLNCLNQALAQQVQNGAPATPVAPIGAGSSSNEVGTFNQQGVAEQYGQNFGKSVIPYRPAPAFNNPVH